MEPLLTTEDVSGWLQVDVVTVRRLITKGELPAYRVGGEYRFKKQEIEEYLERQRVPVRGESGSPFRKMKTLVEKGFIHSPVQDAFQRFTSRARSVLSLAQEEAEQLHHSYIGTEHLLLGIVEEGEGVAARILRSLGADAEKIRSEIHRLLTTRV